jgi:DNA-binding transcriptional MerR regulator
VKESYYKIGQVAALTGVSPARIRLWEASYNLFSSRRTQGGFRLYSDQDIKKICSLKQKLELGWTLQAAAEQLKNDNENQIIETPIVSDGQAVQNEVESSSRT